MDQTIFWMGVAIKVLWWPTILSASYYACKKSEHARHAIFAMTIMFFVINSVAYKLGQESFNMCVENEKANERIETEMAKLQLQHDEYLRLEREAGRDVDLTKNYLIWRP